MRILAASLAPLVLLAAIAGYARDEALPAPGLYRVQVRVDLPNVPDTAPSFVLERCIAPADLESGQAFFVLSENPLRACELTDYQVTGKAVAYRIACRGANRGSATAQFTTARAAYRGTISMNMGGKNMTMSETQVGERIGACR